MTPEKKVHGRSPDIILPTGTRRLAVNPHFKGELIAFAGPTVQVRPHLSRIPLSTTVYQGEKDGKINVVSITDKPAPIRLKKGERPSTT